MAVGAAPQTYNVGGGTAPYSFSSSNTAVATGSMVGNLLTVSAVSGGTAQIVIFDAAGASITISLTVNSGGSTTNLFTVAPSALTLAIGEAKPFAVGGGTGPYVASTSNATVATAVMNGNTLNVNGIAVGTAQILVFDATGASVAITVTVPTVENNLPLFTTAPSTIVMAVGGVGTYSISGGKAPYSFSSSNVSVVTGSINVVSNILSLNAVGFGTAQILVFDSTGASVAIAVTVPSGNDGISLFTSAPSAVTMPAGASSTFSIGGGAAPYTVTSSNIGIATVQTIAGNKFTVTAGAVGAGQLIILDAVGASVSIVVNVNAGNSTTNLYTVAPSNLTLAIGGVPKTFAVGGGTGPYLASTSNASVATASISGNVLTLNGLAAGVAEVFVFDATGASVTITITIPSSENNSPLFTSAPSAVVMKKDGVNSYAIGGGKAPYSFSSSNTNVVTGVVSNVTNTITLQSVAVGTAQIVVLDSTGASVGIAVTVTTGSESIPLFTTAPSDIVTTVGAPHSYQVSGGTAPYLATSSNAAVVTGTITGSTLNLNVLSPGSGQIFVYDANGTAVTISVVVTSGSVSTSLFTTAPSAITMAFAGGTSSYKIGGGSGGYTAASGNAGVATATIVGGTTLTITSIAIGTAQIIVSDSSGATVTILVTIEPNTVLIDVQPGDTSGNVGDSLSFLVRGGVAPYIVTANNTSVATVSIPTVAVAGVTFNATLLNAGTTIVTIVDALGQAKAITLTVSQQITTLRLSPAVLSIAEDNAANIVLNIFGGVGPYRAFTDNLVLTSVDAGPILGTTMTIGLGTAGNRCVNPVDASGVRVPSGSVPVLITVLDKFGASATTTLLIADNNIGTGSVLVQASPLLTPCQ
jgi:hypothetical protein